MGAGDRPGIVRAPFGRLPDGREASLYELRDGEMTVRIGDYGGVVQSMLVPGRDGRIGDVVLGYDSVDGYLAGTAYLGAIIGRYGNRIARGRFTLDGREYALPINNPPNHLHGGPRGLDTVLWDAEPSGDTLRLRHVSPAGDDGYPGRLDVDATYRLMDGCALEVRFAAAADAPTVVNLTQHVYFNLGGEDDVLGHVLQVEADRYTPVDATLIPTGELAPVGGTPFDFRRPAAIGARIDAHDPQLERAHGYDHNFVLRKAADELAPAARVHDPRSGRVVELWTTQPGLQLYSGNYLDGGVPGKGGRRYGFRSGLALEPQHFPDSPNHPSFPSTVLRPGERFEATIVYRFGVE